MKRIIEILLRAIFGRDLKKTPESVVERDLKEEGQSTGRTPAPLHSPEITQPVRVIDATPQDKELAMVKQYIRTSIEGICQILSHEAIVLNRYRDSKGIWTIGPGITAKAKAGINPNTFKGLITVERALDLFDAILPQYERYVYNLMGGKEAASKLKQHEFDALVSLAYNAGNINKPMTRGLARSGEIAGAIDIWRADRVLWKRRDSEVALAKYGIYKAKTILVGMADPNGLVLQSTMRRKNISTIVSNYYIPAGVV